MQISELERQNLCEVYTEESGTHYLCNTNRAMNVEGLEQSFAFQVKGTSLGLMF